MTTFYITMIDYSIQNVYSYKLVLCVYNNVCTILKWKMYCSIAIIRKYQKQLFKEGKRKK